MIRKVLFYCCIILLMLAFDRDKAHASHAMGVDLTYICLGNGQYVFTVSFYRDCSGISAPSSATVNLSSSCGNFTVSLPLVSSVEISSLCPTAISTCQGGNEPGAEQYIYSDTLTLTPCADWTFSYTECCRNPLITNLVSPSAQNMYVEATLDNTGPDCNSSPIFTTLPVPYICDGQPYNYNHGAIDADGDSLVYSLVNPLTTGGGLIGYTGGFTPTNPMTTSTGVSFNTQTGQMEVIPSGIQVAVVTVLIEEYRNGVLIGTTMRDIQIIVLQCGNTPPQLMAPGIINMTGGTLLDTMKVEVCVGSTLSYDVIATDPNIQDVITMTTNAPLALLGSSFSQSGTNPVTGTLVWTPTAADIGFNSYALTIQDDGCPVLGTQTYAFEVHVISGTYAGSDIYLCENDTVQLSVGGGNTFQWTPGYSLSNDTLSNPLAYPDSTTTYVVTSDLTGSCGNIDSITVNVVPDFTASTASEQILCIGGSAQLGVTASPPGTYSYQWSPSATLDNDTIPNPLASPLSTTYYSVDVTSLAGCTKTVTQIITVNPTPLSSDPTSDDDVLCLGSSTGLHANVTTGDCNSYIVSNVPFSPISGNGTQVSLTDDAMSGNLDIGFDFIFFCSFYDMFYVSSNGFLTFNSGSLNGCCSGQALPNAANPNNLVAFCWNDYNPGAGGSINYFTTGTAPNRVLVLNFSNVPHISGGNNATTQVQLHEYTNVIEIHTTNIPAVSGASTMGIENNGGTSAYPVSGRNASSWSASNEGVRFTPLTPPPYTVTWLDQDSNVVGSTEDISVTPDSSMVYTLVVSDGACSDTKTLTVDVSQVVASPDTGMCMGDSVQLNASYLGPTGPNPPNSCGVPTTACTSSPADFVVGTGSSVNGATGYPAPYGNYYRNAKHQFLYTAGDLTASGVLPGTITDIGFFVNFINGTSNYMGYEIKIGCTNITSLSAWQAGLQTVFFPKNVALTTGLNNHMLDIPYDWDGASNLIIEICFNNLALSFTSNSASPYTNTGYNSVIYYRSDATLACPYTATLTTSTSRPNTNFTVCVDSVSPAFTWSPTIGLSDPNIANPMAAPGIVTEYVVSVDNGNCIMYDTVTVTPSTFQMSTGVLNETCSGDCDGAATVTPQGIPPFSYIWSDPDTQTTQTATGLCSGVYLVTVTDGGGCTGITFDTVGAGIIMGTALLDTIAATCNGVCDGVASMLVTGGNGPYDYVWDNGEMTSTAVGLCAGWHMVTITDANGCSTLDSAFIREPSHLTTSTATTCLGACSGNATTNPAGGVPPYSFLWSDPLGQTTPTATGLCAGIYTATVIDSNNCMVIDTVTVYAPSTQISATTCSDTVCGNIATVSIVNGTPPYTFFWNNGQAAPSATNLCPGEYIVQVADSTGCLLVDTAIIPEPILTHISDSNNTSCYAGCDGSATVTLSGGTGPYTYLWDDANNQTDSMAMGLCQGNYIVTITDMYGCTHTSNVGITSPPELTGTTSSTCIGICSGIADIAAVGGTPPYAYQWNDPTGQTTASATGLCVGTYSILVTDDNGCLLSDSTSISAPSNTFSVMDATCLGQCDGIATSIPSGGSGPYTFLWDDSNSQTGSTASNLCVGFYNITITDSLGCQLHDNIFVSESSPLASQLTNLQNVTCFGLCDGAVTIVPAEGLAPYSYSWDDPSGQTNNSAYSLCAGTYVLTITDSEGCMKLDTVLITEPMQLAMNLDSLSLQHVRCSGDCDGEATIIASGGTPPFTYSWDDPTSQTTAVATDLCGGTYTVTVEDNHQCKENLLVDIEEPLKLLADITDTLLLQCEYHCDGYATVTPTGGRIPYTYLWSDPDNQTDSTATGLCVGVYMVKITDSSGCEVIVVDTISAIPAPPLAAGYQADPIVTTIYNPEILFTDLSTGATVVDWDFGDGTTDTAINSPSHLFPDDVIGTYTVWQYITNHLGCEDSISSEVIIKGDFALFAPSAFTPNGDGINETFFPKGFGIDKDNFNLYIYNRWGDMIYETDNIDIPWDGRVNSGEEIAQIGVYVWMIITYDIDGNEHQFVGKVTLLR